MIRRSIRPEGRMWFASSPRGRCLSGEESFPEGTAPREPPAGVLDLTSAKRDVRSEDSYLI